MRWTKRIVYAGLILGSAALLSCWLLGSRGASPAMDAARGTRGGVARQSLADRLALAVADGSSRPEAFADVEVPRISAHVTIDRSGHRVARPGEGVAARQRAVFVAKDYEIRETLVPDERRPVRFLEEVKFPKTEREQVVRREEMVADRVILRLASKGAKSEARLAELGLKVRRKLGGQGALLVDLKPGQRIEEALAALRAAKLVAYAEPDWIVHTLGTPNDPDFSKLWGMHNTGQTGGSADADIDAPEAWDLCTGSSGVVVAVIDTGIDYTHPDLAANMWVNPGEIAGNGIDDDGDGFVDDVYGADFANDDADPKDDHFHGTHCAGTIGAVGDNGVGVAGVCWNVKLMALKFLDSWGSGAISDAVLAVDFARTHGAKVLSNSWGGGGYSQAMYDAIGAANDAGILFVAAAGNDGTNNDSEPLYPASYAVANVVAVAATDCSDALAGFSNYGAGTVHLGAPGVSIYSTFPTYMTGELTSRGWPTDYYTISGTSMATPHVCGAAALLLSHEPALSAADVRARLIERVDPVAGLLGKTVSGGRLNVFHLVDPAWEPVVPRVVLAGTTINDSVGNGNGFPECTEIVTLTPTFVNLGQTAASSVTVTLSTTDPHVTIQDGTESVGSIASLGSVTAPNAFRVSIAAGVTQDTQVLFTVTAADGSGHETVSPYSFYIPKPEPQSHVAINFAPGQILADPGRDIVYIIDHTYLRVLALDTNTGTTAASAPLTGSPYYSYGTTDRTCDGQMAISLDGSRLYVALTVDQKIEVFSLPDLESVAVFEFAFKPVSLVCGQGGRLYASGDEYWGRIRQIDDVAGTVLAEFDDGSNFYKHSLLRASADGSRLFVAETGLKVVGGPGYVREFDVTGGQAPVLLHKHPFVENMLGDYALDEPYNRIYTMNGGVYAVQTTKTDTGQYGIAWPIRTPYPTAISFLPGSGAVYGATGSSSYDVRKFLRTDGTPLNDYMLLQDPYTAYQSDLFPRHMRVAHNGVVVGIKNRWTGNPDVGIEGYLYWVALIGRSSVCVDTVTALPQSVETEQNVSTDITLTAACIDSSPLTYEVVTQPAHGTIEGTAPDLAYTPDTDYVGPDSFTFRANDGRQDSGIATVTIMVRIGGVVTTLKACGANASGQLGDGTTTNRVTPVDVYGPIGVSAMACGSAHSLAVMSSGGVMAWGDNTYGQLGNGTTTSSLTPISVPGLTGVKEVAAGAYHTLALMNDGTVMAWGRNNNGQLGDGTTTTRLAPVAVSGLSDVKAVAAGQYHSVAVLVDGTVKAWGANGSGQLGDGSTTQRTAPVAVTDLSGGVAVGAGQSHSAAVLSDGTVRAWGYNGYGQLGNGTTTSSSVPVVVSGLATATRVTCGQYFTLVLMSDGSVYGCGSNGSGQLGDKSTTQRTTPVYARYISGTKMTGATGVAAGNSHTVVVKSDGKVFSWGSNGSGELGHDYPNNYTIVPSTSLLTDALAVSASAVQTMVLINNPNPNLPPVITASSPDSPTTVYVGYPQPFSVACVDPNDDVLSYVWKLDGMTLGETSNTFVFAPTTSSTDRTISVTVSDGRGGSTGTSWLVSVRLKTYTITASAGTGGTISPCGEVLTSHGANRVFNVTPDQGYKIADVTVDTVSVGAVAQYTFSNVTADHLIAASFVPSNTPPVANDQAVAVTRNQAKAVTLTAVDADGDVLAYDVVTSPGHGTLTGTAPHLTYTPDADWTGADMFTFKANDGTVESNVATVAITVTAPNTPPVISTYSPETPFTMWAGSSQVFEVWAQDDDGDGLNYLWKLDGAEVGTNASSYSYGPAVAGQHTVEVSVSDGQGGVATHTWDVTVLSTDVTLLAPVGKVSQRRPEFSWGAVAGAEKYELWVRDCTDGTNPVLHEEALVGTTYTPGVDLSWDHTYEWWVRAYAGGSWAPWRSYAYFAVVSPDPVLLAPRGANTEKRPEFSWEAVSGAEQYEIWVRDCTSGTNPVLNDSTITGTTYTPGADLTLGHTYEWWLRARVGGTWAPWRSYTFFVIVPGDPVLVSPRGPVSQKRPEFSWEAVTGAEKYEIWVRDCTAGTNPVLNVNTITGTTYTPGVDLTLGHVYEWWVRAYAGGAWAPWRSYTFCVIVPGDPVLLAPQGQVSQLRPEFSWEAVAEATKYEIWVRDCTDGTNPVLNDATITGTTYTPGVDLTAGHTYEWWLRAYGGGAWAPWRSYKYFSVQP